METTKIPQVIVYMAKGGLLPFLLALTGCGDSTHLRLELATAKNDIPLIKDICANNDVASIINKPNKRHLPVICYSKSLEVLELLVDHGADVNVKMTSGASPLAWLVNQESSPDMIQFMLDKGAVVESVEIESPFHLAVRRGNVDLVEVFLKNGANPRFKGRDGKDAFEAANDIDDPSNVKEMILEMLNKAAQDLPVDTDQ